MNEKNDPRSDLAGQGLSSTDDRSAIPLGQRPPVAGTTDQSPASQQPRADQLKGEQSRNQPQEDSEGAIPKAVEAIEKAADKGLEKTSDVVGGTIDKVADAAINVLGGKPDHNNS